jgi:hypothetical protein
MPQHRLRGLNEMTARLPFTAAAVARAILGAKRAGMPITATSVAPDGTVTLHHVEIASPTVPEPTTDAPRSEWEDIGP